MAGFVGIECDDAEDIDYTSDPKILSDDTLEYQLKLLENEISKVESELGDLDKTTRDKTTSDDLIEIKHFVVPQFSVPIRSDVRIFPWKKLGNWCQFDVVMMDPPWQLASSAPTRGVALGFSQLPNRDIINIPINLVQSSGFIFIWVINSRYSFALEMMKLWGYTFVDDITWVKSTVNGRLAKGHGFYLQHAKETCLVGRKGQNDNYRENIASDVIVAKRRGQSQKPEEIYNLIEQLVPDGNYLEIFARRNNLRDNWVSIGLEL